MEKYPNGEIRYEGDFSVGYRAGQGKYYLLDGAYYEGEFMNNLPGGTGTFYHTEGGWSTGTFKDGMLEGDGKYYDSTGALRFEGDFELGDWVRGTEYLEDGSRYEGE